MSKSRVLKNYLYNTAYQLLILLTPLITAPYISRVLGATGIGVYSYARSIVTYFILFGTVGGSLYGQREIAYCQNNLEKRTQVFKEILSLRFITVILSLICYFVIFAQGAEYRVIYRTLIIEIVAAAFDVSWFFQGMEDFKKTVLRNTIVRLLSVAMIFIFVKDKDDVPIYTLCCSLPTLVGNLSLWIYLPQYITKSKINIKNIKKHFAAITALFLPQIAIEIYTVLDKTMIGLLSTSVAEVGYYTQSQKIVKLALQIVTSLGTVMLPAMSVIFSSGNKDKVIATIIKSFKIMFFMAFPIMFGLISITNNLVPWFFGGGFEPVIPLMKMASPIIILIGISNVLGMQYLLPTNHQNMFTISVVGGAITNFVFNFILIPKFNSIGATAATLASEAVVSFLQILFVKKDLPILRIFKQNIRYFIMGIIMGILVYIVGFLFGAKIIGTIIQVLVGIIIYIIELKITKDEIFNEIIYIIQNQIFHMKNN